MLKETDKKIIFELQRNGRSSYAEMASNLGFSASTVAKRTERLLKENFITVRALLNPYQMGLSANALIAIKADPLKIESIYESLNDNLYVNMFSAAFGRYDIIMHVYFPNWDMLHNFINEELFGLDGVLQMDTYYVKDIKKRYEGLFDVAASYETPPKLKDIDLQLIRLLIQNGRMGTNDLSEVTGTHPSTISRRISALLKDDIIKIRAVPNPVKVGMSAGAHIVLEVETNEVDSICEDLYRYKDVHQIMTLIKGNGLIIGIHSASNEQLYELIKEKIARIPGFIQAETFIRAKMYKHYYGTFLENGVHLHDNASAAVHQI